MRQFALALLLLAPACKKHGDAPAAGSGSGSAGSGSAHVRKPLPPPLSVDDAKAGCDKEIPPACGQLAFYYAHGTQVPKDLERAKNLATPGCNLGDGRSCFVLGALVEMDPDASKRDDVRAMTLYKKACGANDAAACAELGMAYFSGRTSAGADPNQAVVSFGKACELGDDVACKQQELVQPCLQNPKVDAMCARMSAPRR